MSWALGNEFISIIANQYHFQKTLNRNQVNDLLVSPLEEQQEYSWGYYNLYALYPIQQALPKRVRLLLDFIESHMRNM